MRWASTIPIQVCGNAPKRFSNSPTLLSVNIRCATPASVASCCPRAGAALGALLRWWLGLRLNPLFATLPAGTLSANLIGAYVIGLALVFGTSKLKGVGKDLGGAIKDFKESMNTNDKTPPPASPSSS